MHEFCSVQCAGSTITVAILNAVARWRAIDVSRLQNVRWNRCIYRSLNTTLTILSNFPYAIEEVKTVR